MNNIEILEFESLKKKLSKKKWRFIIRDNEVGARYEVRVEYKKPSHLGNLNLLISYHVDLTEKQSELVNTLVSYLMEKKEIIAGEDGDLYLPKK